MHLVVIGGSDAGISTALRARELDPSAEVTVVVADAYPNFSICGIPMLIGQEVGHWTDLAHRTRADLEATGMRLELDTLATRVDAAAQELWVRPADGVERAIGYDELVVGTGAVPLRPPIEVFDGPGALGPQDGVHLLLRVFDLVVGRTGLRQHEAIAAGRGWCPVTTQSSPDDHKVYYPGATPIYPGATPIEMRVTGDRDTGRLLGAQLVGRLGAEVAKRVDTFALVLLHGMRVAEMDELDLSYTPPLGSLWDAVQVAAQAWVREHELPAVRRGLVRA